MPPTHPHPPQLLVASHNHGAGLELLELAERRGFTIRRAQSAAQALEQAHAAPPDLVVLDESLTDLDALATTRALRDDPHVGPGTPLLLISAQRPSSPQHHAALRAGVWEFLRHPFHVEEIGAKLDSYVRLKLDSDRTGAVLLAERVARGVTAAGGGGGTPVPGLRAGYDAVGNARYTPIEPKNLLARATTALRTAKGQGGPGWIQGCT